MCSPRLIFLSTVLLCNNSFYHYCLSYYIMLYCLGIWAMTVSCHCIWYENLEKNWVCSPRAYLNSVSLSVNLFYKDLKPRGGTLVMWTDPQSLKVWMLMVVVVVMTTTMMMMMVNIVLKHAIFSDSLGQRDWRQNSVNIENLSSIRSSGKMINWKDDRKVSCFPLLIAIQYAGVHGICWKL